MRVTRCQFCCDGCGSHFSSLRAFDAHRVGSSSDRRCLNPKDDERFTPVALNARCEMGARAERGVTVWTLASTLAAARSLKDAA